MPTRPKQFALHARTPEQREADRQAHWRKQNEGRLSSAKRGYDRHWRTYRLAYLAEHAACIACQAEGRLTPATVVEHITPHEGNYQLFWDARNHQPMCKHHADAKTARETNSKRAASKAQAHTRAGH